jgi:DMSO/TMAO reductase YedYZ molybdopterin-dependent catalytic subunit
VKPTTLIGAVIGLITAAVSVGVGELAAAFVRPQAAPVIAVGNRIVLLTPESVTRTVIKGVGTNDKTVLVTSIYLLLFAFGISIGINALKRLRYGLGGVAVLGAFGVYCALTAHASKVSDSIPTIIATLVSGAVLAGLVHASKLTSPNGAPPTSAAGDAGVYIADRRLFVQSTVGAAALAALSGLIGRSAVRARFEQAVEAKRDKIVLPAPTNPAPALPSGTDLDKSSIPWQTPSSSFYRIDTALSVPDIDPSHWSLRIHGMVDKEIKIDYAQLLARPLIERWITLCCVSNEVGGNLIGNAKWLGAPLADLLREAGVQSGSDQLVMSSSDGMTIGAPTKVVMDGRDAMLAVGMNGSPLPLEHGFPVRVVVPGLYGYVSACKWVVDINATTFDDEAAYWVSEGWDRDPSIKLESRIDTPRSGKTVPIGSTVAIAGVAWDQHVGVSKVEVQIGDGEWQQARLAPVPSTDTWRQWVLAWLPTQAGSYRVRVRAVDAMGVPQTEKSADPFPSGATGLHSILIRAH